jgi:RHS repeat-associated protein
VTNLRLPGQYDERLFWSVGLQGPYYNWNRWYLPGVGRYLELDPIALGEGFNGFGSPWYNYALSNPLRWTDVMGLAWCPPGLANEEGPRFCYKLWEPPKPPPPVLPEWECFKRCSSGMSPWPLMFGRFVDPVVGGVTSGWGIGTKVGCAVYCSQRDNYCPKLRWFP